MGCPVVFLLISSYIILRKCLRNCSVEYKPVFYNRYVDDTCAEFKSTHPPDLSLKYLNNNHSSIKFTREKENNNQLAFLDILISNADRFKTSIFAKACTFTGLGTNFLSICSHKFKINAITTLMHRVIIFPLTIIFSILNYPS